MDGIVPMKDARKGEKVTIITQHGGTGVGFLYKGQVWVASGSYWATNAKASNPPMTRYIRDGGKAYMKKVREL